MVVTTTSDMAITTLSPPGQRPAFETVTGWLLPCYNHVTTIYHPVLATSKTDCYKVATDSKDIEI